MERPKKIVFAPENVSWGGSEILWAKTIVELASLNFIINICVHSELKLPNWIIQLEKNKQLTIYAIPVGNLPKLKRILNRVLPYHKRFKPKNQKQYYILKCQPDLLVINQGFNYNGVATMAFAKENKIDYITISHALNEGLWPNLSLRKQMQLGFENSMNNYFVSQDNLEVTESQLGVRLSSSEVIRNPFNVPFDVDLEYPKQEKYHLAFVGRFDFYAKGQDVLMRVLALDKWKSRNLIVNFYGEGNDVENLKDLITLYGIKNAFIHSQTEPTEIWKHNQGLILTSRFEGLPLVLVEAMLCKRMVIVTNVSGNKELLRDNETGFIATAARPEYVDEAMERAWLVRNQWKLLGEQARQEIIKQIPENPAKVFADKLVAILNKN